LWVSRMILMSGFHLGQVPFKTVMLHGLVRDKQGRKFSKSLNNGIDPLNIIDRYGADALRMGLLVGSAIGSDISFDENKVKGYKHFANKLWNIARFVLENTEGHDSSSKLDADDQKRKKEFEELVQDITRDMEECRIYMAAEKIYHYVWHQFADVILEESKLILGNPRSPSTASEQSKNSKKVLITYLLDNSLRMLHPFIPFVTEEIWQSMPTKDAPFLMVAKWPA